MDAIEEENANSLMPMDPHPDAPPYYLKTPNANKEDEDDKNNIPPPVIFMGE
jgi:hypothetical protein